MSKQHEMVGKVFPTNYGGDCVVVEYRRYSDILVRFLDNYKYEVRTSVDSVQKGTVRNPYAPTFLGRGFLGVGKYKVSENGKKSPEYCSWSGSFTRCYSEKVHLIQPTYKDCQVDKRWWNFQTFGDWYTSQEFYGLGYHLDKDLLVRGNKVYSPETCCLVPQEINSLLTDALAGRGDYPIGVSYVPSRGKFVASIRPNNKMKHLGYFSNAEDAAFAFKVAKEQRVKEKALKWKGRVDNKVFEALINWKLD